MINFRDELKVIIYNNWSDSEKFEAIDELFEKKVNNNINNQKELLLAFFKYAKPIYWGENSYCDYEDIIDLFLKQHNQI